MKWQRKGHIFNFDKFNKYFYQNARVPVPEIHEEYIRFYLTSQDKCGIGRPTFIECDIDDFSKIIRINAEPLFENGCDNSFDSDGCMPISIVNLPDGKKYMYYVGFELGTKIRYRLLSGLAVSDDGERFYKHSNVPILERTNKELLFRGGPYVIFEKGIFRMWYAAGSTWIDLNGKKMPSYTINYLESNDGISWGNDSKICIRANNENEYGFGRPYVIKHENTYKMFYSVRYKDVGYRLGYAESEDGIVWERKDDQMNFDVSSEGWDSEVVAYSAVVNIKGEWYMFYNGNGMGKTGFGYAKLLEW